MDKDLQKAIGFTAGGVFCISGILSTLFWVLIAMVKALSIDGFFIATGEPTHLDEIPHFVFWITGGLAIAVFIIFLIMTFFRLATK